MSKQDVTTRSSPGHRAARDVSYIPKTSTDWTGPPTDVADALDECRGGRGIIKPFTVGTTQVGNGDWVS